MSRKPWEFENPTCAEVGLDVFYIQDIDEDPETSSYDHKEARKLCSSCVYRTECAEWGIVHEAFGIWGGLTPRERVQIRRARHINISL